ncbi:MAG: NAD+ synthase [Planctomycetota bacterium]
MNQLEIDPQLVEQLLVRFVRDETRSAGLSKVVVGLSGGVDSAVSAAIAARALGPDNTLALALPYKASSASSLTDAMSVASQLGIELCVVDVSPQIDAYFAGDAQASSLRRGNKMARERMSILYDRSAASNALVLGTSNKTELLLGYGTLHGDMASAINPIGDLYKTQVFMMARHFCLPDAVVTKPPSADLWQGQTDESEMGFAYADVDALLYDLVERRYSAAELLAAGYAREFIERVRRMISRSQFKRRMPIIAKLGSRTINADFQYPRDWGT